MQALAVRVASASSGIPPSKSPDTSAARTLTTHGSESANELRVTLAGTSNEPMSTTLLTPLTDLQLQQRSLRTRSKPKDESLELISNGTGGCSNDGSQGDLFAIFGFRVHRFAATVRVECVWGETTEAQRAAAPMPQRVPQSVFCVAASSLRAAFPRATWWADSAGEQCTLSHVFGLALKPGHSSPCLQRRL